MPGVTGNIMKPFSSRACPTALVFPTQLSFENSHLSSRFFLSGLLLEKNRTTLIQYFLSPLVRVFLDRSLELVHRKSWIPLDFFERTNSKKLMTMTRPSTALAATPHLGADTSQNGEEVPKFTSILVARSNTARPSELEVYLRSHCRKMKVNTRLSGAHMIVQNSDGAPSISVRCYYPLDLERLEQQQKRRGIQSDIKTGFDDGLAEFVRHFQWTVVFFILPSDLQKTSLGDGSSFLRRSMHFLDDWSLEQHQQSLKTTKNPPRIVVLQRTPEAVQYLTCMADALKPAKQKLRSDFFQKQQRVNYCCPNSNNNNEHAAARAAEALRQLADRLGLAAGEADLLMRVLGRSGKKNNLSSIVAADAQALEHVPMEESAKKSLLAFFETGATLRSMEEEVNGNGQLAPSEAAMFPPTTVRADGIVEMQHQSQYPAGIDAYQPVVPENVGTAGNHMASNTPFHAHPYQMPPGDMMRPHHSHHLNQHYQQQPSFCSNNAGSNNGGFAHGAFAAQMQPEYGQESAGWSSHPGGAPVPYGAPSVAQQQQYASAPWGEPHRLSGLTDHSRNSQYSAPAQRHYHNNM